MYYENKNVKMKNQIILVVFLCTIIALLCILIIKIDVPIQEVQMEKTNYTASKLSTNIEENVDNKKENLVRNVTNCVVGISKLEKNGNSIFLENSSEKLGIGSGVILTENGYILTNQHVAGDKYSNCYVTLENGQIYNGSVVWSDSNIDLAIVKISASNLEYITLGDSDNIELTDEVYAIGNPIGIEFQRTITKGIISGINRTIKIENEEEENYMEDLIQTDATINEGNSGGALVTKKAELIGINTIKITDAEGIGFAVPINIVKPILEKLMKNSKFEEAYLGIYGYDKEVIPYLNSNLNITSGIFIAKILMDGPLYGKDVQIGDVIVEIDGVELNKMNDLKKYIYIKNPKDEVTLKIRRGESTFDMKINLGYRT